MAALSARITYAEDLGTEVVSVYVGPDRKHYVVHKKLLTSKSDYFDKALNGKFKEAEENKIHLEEDDPAAIGLMIGYLYRGVIPGTGKKATPFTQALAGSGETYLVKPPAFPAFGTSAVPFRPFIAADPHGGPNNTDAYHNVCFFSQYGKFSQEELRLSDCRLNRKFASSAPATPAAPAAPSAIPPTTAVPSAFRAPNIGWGGTLPPPLDAQQSSGPIGSFGAALSGSTGLFGASLSGSQSSPQLTAPAGSNPSLQSSGLFGTLTSTSQPPIVQVPLPPLPSPSSTTPQSVFRTATQNVSMPTSNIFGPLRSSSASGTLGSTTGAVTASEVIRVTIPSIFSSSSGSGSGAASSIPNLPSAPSGSVTTRNTGLSIFGNFPAASPGQSNPKPAPKKQGEFGYSPTINYPKPDGSFIKGIPRSEPLGDLMVDETALQDALLHLCIFAETVCWPKLFNVAMDAYMLGELNLRRDILLEHVDIIYDRTHPDSTLRAFVMDSIRRLNNPDSCKKYMELAQQYEDFLANLLQAVSLGLAKKDTVSTFAEMKKSYFMSEEPFASSKLQKSALNVAESHEEEVL